MRKSIWVLLLLILISNSYTLGQINTIGKIAHNEIEYEIKENLEFNAWLIQNSKNFIENSLEFKNFNAENVSTFLDHAYVLSEISKSFTPERINELKKHRAFIIRMFHDVNGNILEVAFAINKKTPMTISEIYNMESNIKKNLKITFEGHSSTDGGKYFIHTKLIKFE